MDRGDPPEAYQPPLAEGAQPGLSSSPPVPAPRWGIGDAVWGFSVSCLLLAIVGLVLGGKPVARSFLGLVIAQAALWSGLVGASLWASHKKGSGSLARDFGLQFRRRDAGWGIPAGLVCQLALVPLIYWVLRLLTFDVSGVERPARELAGKAQGSAFIVLAVMLVVGAPLVEELFFRGLLLRALARRFGDGWALGVSSVAFAAAHLELLQFPALLVVGVVFGFLVMRSGRLGPAIWAHGTFNGVVVLVLLVNR